MYVLFICYIWIEEEIGFENLVSRELGDVSLLYELSRHLTSSLEALLLVFACHVIRPENPNHSIN